jgi:hypothetical protein
LMLQEQTPGQHLLLDHTVKLQVIVFRLQVGHHK